jgi:hypothetical protein
MAAPSIKAATAPGLSEGKSIFETTLSSILPRLPKAPGFFIGRTTAQRFYFREIDKIRTSPSQNGSYFQQTGQFDHSLEMN